MGLLPTLLPIMQWLIQLPIMQWPPCSCPPRCPPRSGTPCCPPCCCPPSCPPRLDSSSHRASRRSSHPPLFLPHPCRPCRQAHDEGGKVHDEGGQVLGRGGDADADG